MIGWMDDWMDGWMDGWGIRVWELSSGAGRWAVKRNNVNRGYRDLRVWQDAVDLYVLVSRAFAKPAFELGKVTSNLLDAANSISRNIAEGYCRRSAKEYLNFLNIALGSCGELLSAVTASNKASQLPDDKFEAIDTLHYKVENELLKLIQAIRNKNRDGEWNEAFSER
ncbi:MAG: four helix bundle protein [Planctomycetaceae bacterium]|nr:four helix bundle protein [Planctomycetaceae bacterium]